MAEPFLAEIRMFGFNFAPQGWAFCDGQILPISQNQSLYSLLGTTYGGDGETTFALPDLRGRTPIHVGQSGGASHVLGESSGSQTVVLSAAQIPAHQHEVVASNAAGETSAVAGNYLASGAGQSFNSGDSPVNMAADAVANAGSSVAHDNMQPYLAVRFAIAIQGLFPSN